MIALAHVSERTHKKLTNVAASAKTTRELRVRRKFAFHCIPSFALFKFFSYANIIFLIYNFYIAKLKDAYQKLG